MFPFVPEPDLELAGAGHEVGEAAGGVDQPRHAEHPAYCTALYCALHITLYLYHSARLPPTVIQETRTGVTKPGIWAMVLVIPNRTPE